MRQDRPQASPAGSKPAAPCGRSATQPTRRDRHFQSHPEICLGPSVTALAQATRRVVRPLCRNQITEQISPIRAHHFFKTGDAALAGADEWCGVLASIMKRSHQRRWKRRTRSVPAASRSPFSLVRDTNRRQPGLPGRKAFRLMSLRPARPVAGSLFDFFQADSHGLITSSARAECPSSFSAGWLRRDRFLHAVVDAGGVGVGGGVQVVGRRGHENGLPRCP